MCGEAALSSVPKYLCFRCSSSGENLKATERHPRLIQLEVDDRLRLTAGVTNEEEVVTLSEFRARFDVRCANDRDPAIQIEVHVDELAQQDVGSAPDVILHLEDPVHRYIAIADRRGVEAKIFATDALAEVELPHVGEARR